MFIIKRKLKFEDYKACFATTQIEKIKQIIQIKLDVNSLREDHKEFIKKNKLNLELKSIIFLLNKLIRLLYVQMMIKEYNQLI